MDDSMKLILAGIARHALTTLGGALVARGYLDSGTVGEFVGAGMVLAGVGWSWWQKRGQTEITELLKKMTKTKTTAGAVAVAKIVTPPAPK